MITMVVIKTAINTVTIIIIIIIIINVNQASLYCLHLVVVCIVTLVTPLQHEIAVLANMLQIAPMHTVAIRQFVGLGMHPLRLCAVPIVI